jgi:hypothetical protein
MNDQPAEYRSRGWMRPDIMAYMVASLIIVFRTEITGASQLAINQPPAPTIRRVCRSVNSIFNELGPVYTSRAYRMDAQAFWTLHRKLYPHMGYRMCPLAFPRRKEGMVLAMVAFILASASVLQSDILLEGVLMT